MDQETGDIAAILLLHHTEAQREAIALLAHVRQAAANPLKTGDLWDDAEGRARKGAGQGVITTLTSNGVSTIVERDSFPHVMISHGKSGVKPDRRGSWPYAPYAKRLVVASVRNVEHDYARFTSLPVLALGASSASGLGWVPSRPFRRSHQRAERSAFHGNVVWSLWPRWPWLTRSPGSRHAAHSCSRNKPASGRIWIGALLAAHTHQPTMLTKPIPSWKASCWRRWICWSNASREGLLCQFCPFPAGIMPEIHRCYSLIQG